jgi:hypothetical protein
MYVKGKSKLVSWTYVVVSYKEGGNHWLTIYKKTDQPVGREREINPRCTVRSLDFNREDCARVDVIRVSQRRRRWSVRWIIVLLIQLLRICGSRYLGGQAINHRRNQGRQFFLYESMMVVRRGVWKWGWRAKWCIQDRINTIWWWCRVDHGHSGISFVAYTKEVIIKLAFTSFFFPSHCTWIASIDCYGNGDAWTGLFF